MEARNLQFCFLFEGEFSSAQFDRGVCVHGEGTKKEKKLSFRQRIAECVLSHANIWLGQRVVD